jgi:hypothetical protein
MPLNQSQRTEIELSIAHLFYDLSEISVTSLRDALEEPLFPPHAEEDTDENDEEQEEKEREEKSSHHNPFESLTQLITTPESVLKRLETHNKDSAVTVNEVKAYIIFYSICCAQYHLQNKMTDEDFDLPAWLQSNSVTAADLAKPWNLANFLMTTHANDFFASRDWDIDETFNALQALPDHPFQTQNPSVDHGSYNCNWDLPRDTNRMYHAEIRENWEHVRNSTGQIVCILSTINLHVKVNLPDEKNNQVTLKNFLPYPTVPALSAETLKGIDDLINGQEFASPALKTLARNNAITRAENNLLMQAEVQIKEKAQQIAEKEAFNLLLKDLKKQNNRPTSSAASAHNSNPSNELSISDLDNDDMLELDVNLIFSPQANSSASNARTPSLSQAEYDDDEEDNDEKQNRSPQSHSTQQGNTQTVNRPRSPSLVSSSQPIFFGPPPLLRSDNSFSVPSPEPSSEAKQQSAPSPEEKNQHNLPPAPRPSSRRFYPRRASLHIDASEAMDEEDELAGIQQFINSIRSQESTQTALITIPPPPPLPTAQNALIPLSLLPPLPAVSQPQNSALPNILPLGLFANAAPQPRALPVIADIHPPGLVLLTYTHYFDEVKAGELTIDALKTFSPDETHSLRSHPVMRLLKDGLIERYTALQFQPGIIKLLETPYFFRYFQQHPDKLLLFMQVSLTHANFMSLPFVTSLLERGDFEPDYFLAFTADEATVMKYNVFGELFYRVPQAIQHIKGINAVERDFLLHETVRTCIDNGSLPIQVARAFAKAIPLQQAEKRVPLLIKLLRTDPYKTALAEKPEFIAHLQTWTAEQLERLFMPSIVNLLTQKTISIEYLINPAPNFFAVLSGAHISQLLIDKKITLNQALRLTPNHLNDIENNQMIYDLFRTNTDNDNTADYMPLKIWSYIFNSRLVAAFRVNLWVHHPIPDTVATINTHISAVADVEHLSRTEILNRTIKLFLCFLRDEINTQLINVSRHAIPPIYTSMLNDINITLASSTPQWLETLASLAARAQAGLTNHRSRSHFYRTQAAPPVYNQHAPHYFNSPSRQLIQHGVYTFCQRLLPITALYGMNQNRQIEQLQPAAQRRRLR